MELTSSPEELFIRRENGFANTYEVLDSSDELNSPEIVISGTDFTRLRRNHLNGTGIKTRIQSHPLQSYPSLHGFSRNLNMGQTSAAIQSYRDVDHTSHSRHLGESDGYVQQLENSYQTLEREYAFTQGELQASR